jgi:hypothetical protein
MGQAYDLFLKQMGGKTSTGNKDPCSKYCSNYDCQKSCGHIKHRNFDILTDLCKQKK